MLEPIKNKKKLKRKKRNEEMKWERFEQKFLTYIRIRVDFKDVYWRSKESFSRLAD